MLLPGEGKTVVSYAGWFDVAGQLKHHAAHIKMLEFPSVFCQLLCLLNNSPEHILHTVV